MNIFGQQGTYGLYFQTTNATLQGYTRDKLQVLGTIEIKYQVSACVDQDRQCHLELFVVGGTGRDVIGRPWLEAFTLAWLMIVGM